MSIPHIIILGAGAAGMCMAMQLKRAGIERFTIVEKKNAIGGTWRDNSYPGSGCDVPSHLYCFSFEPNPDWSRKFAEQPEILAYLERCAEKYRLHDHIQFDTEVTSARFEEGVWRIATSRGELMADVLISGCGQLNRPHIPAIEGLDQFEGTHFHSARWQHDHSLEGKHVAVVGNGASAIQFVPRIAPRVASLKIFQRSAHWIVKKPDRAYSAIERTAFRRLPWLRRLHRYQLYWQMEARFAGFREGSFVNKIMGVMARRELEQITDPNLRERLTPDYTVGCKRILISNDYFDTVQQPHVEVVGEPIVRFAPDGVVTQRGMHRVDTAIFATGFESTKFLSPMEIHGTRGTLSEAWRDGARAYLGIAIPGFPNFFVLYGPNTNLGHNSIIFMVECQVRYILQLIFALRDGVTSLDVKPAVMTAYDSDVQQMLSDSVWGGDCSNWYKNDAGRIVNNWGSYTPAYWWRTRRLDLSAFTVAR